MKKTLLLLTALCGILTAAAQDLIVKTDSTRIESKVTQITPSEVSYKRFSNPDGPIYVLPVTDIQYIRYANGERDTFKAAPKKVTVSFGATFPGGESRASAPTTQQPASAAPVQTATVQNATMQAATVGDALKTYRIGELYDVGGVRGIVCALSDDQRHGMILSLDEQMLAWSVFSKGNYRLIGADSSGDGMVNMEKTADYIAQNGLTWDDFPAFKWCRALGDGWYLPAIDELLIVGQNFNGGTRLTYNRDARNKFNDALKDNGGKRLNRLVYYFSSTEVDEKQVDTSHMGMDTPYVIEIPKANKFLVRAVHKF